MALSRHIRNYFLHPGSIGGQRNESNSFKLIKFGYNEFTDTP